MLPNTNVLVLISEMLAAIKVVGFDNAGRCTVEELRAALWGQIVVVAAVLGDLEIMRQPIWLGAVCCKTLLLSTLELSLNCIKLHR